MAKSLTQNSVIFSNVKTESEYTTVGAGLKINGVDGVDPNFGGIINAVDIDWNGATLGSSIINTTGELLSWIKTSLSGKQASLGSAVGTATNPVYWDGSKFVKTTYTLSKSVPSTAVFTDTVKTLPELVGTSAIGNATKPIYWDGSKFVTANNYPSGVSSLKLEATNANTQTGDGMILSPATYYTLTVGDKSLVFKTPTDNTGSAADGNTTYKIKLNGSFVGTGSTDLLNGSQIYAPTSLGSANQVLKVNSAGTGLTWAADNTGSLTGLIGTTAIGTATNPVYWDGSKFVKTTYTLGKSVPSTAVFTDTVYTHPSYTAKSSGLYKVTVDNTGHVSAATAVSKSDITGLGIPAQDTVYTHPTFTAKSSGLYKITVDANGHVTGTAAVTASDLKSVIKDLLVAGDNITITENSAGKLVVSCTGVQAETIALKVIGTLKENGAEVVMTATSAAVQSVLATDTNTYVNSNWAIDNTTNFSINATSNVSAVTVTANVSAAKGTVSGSIGSTSQTTSYGKRALTASFTQVPTTKSTKVTATHDGSSSYVTLKYTKAGQAAGTYNWSGTLPAGLTYSATTGTSIEVRNSTSSEITVAKDVVQVTNANGTAAYKFASFTVPGKQNSTTYYFSVGTTEVTSSNYTTANNATTTIPTSIEYTSSQRVRHYFLVPSNKTLSVIDKNAQVAVPITENTTHGISNHKLYYTNGAIAVGGTVVISLS